MANPFKEAEKAKKKAPGSKQEPEVTEEKVVEVEEAPVVQEKPTEKPETKPAAGKPQKKSEKPEKPALDIFANLRTEKPTGKTYAFYLSDENGDKLKKMAEEKGISASKLLDHILSEVL